MYKIVYFNLRVKINGIRRTIFGNEKEYNPIKYITRSPMLVKEEDLEDVINNYKEKIKESIMEDFNNNYVFFCDSTEHGYRLKDIKSIKFTNDRLDNFRVKVVDVDSVSYEELRKIANVRELMEIEEYYKKLI